MKKMSAKKELILIFAVLVVSQVVTSIGCPSSRVAKKLFKFKSAKDLNKLKEIMWRIHEVE